MNKIAAVVILYYPEQSTIKNIRSYSLFVETVFAIDNSENPSKEFKDSIAKIENCIYLQHNENHGIAKRLNEACEMAKKKGFKWLLTMDQDSSFANGMFEKYLICFENFHKDDVALFGVNYMPDILPPSDDPVLVLSTITSGNLVNLTLHDIIGGFNEELFIDLVDAEYCYRANNLNFKIIVFANIVLTHKLGYIQYGRSLKNFKLTPRILHNPVRIYYIVRNCFYLLYKFPNLPKQARKEIRNCLSLLKNNILYNKKRTLVIKNIIRGYWDYKRNKMGKFEP